MVLDKLIFPIYKPNNVPNSHNLPSVISQIDPQTYIPSQDLIVATNLSILSSMPLLILGQSGMGKTMFAHHLAWEFQMSEPLIYNCHNGSKSQDIFYEFDYFSYYQDINKQPETNKEMREYITYQALGKAILQTLSYNEIKQKNYLPKSIFEGCPKRSVILIDDIHKAPKNFVSDVLYEIEEYQFSIKELQNINICADLNYAPLLIFTSLETSKLPDAFLRRCIACFLAFPLEDHLIEISKKSFGHLIKNLDEILFHTIGFLHFIREKREISLKKYIDWLSLIIKDVQKNATIKQSMRAHLKVLSSHLEDVWENWAEICQKK